MNIQYHDGEARFYFICEACGEPIHDCKGVVDFPLSISKNQKAPLRFYHRGPCASAGEDRRAKDMWGCWNLDDFVASLLDGELPEMIKLFTGIR